MPSATCNSCYLTTVTETVTSALGNLGLRNDYIFGASFLIIRIVYHAVLTFNAIFNSDAAYAKWGANQKYSGTLKGWTVTLCLLTLALHSHWMYAW